jgi:hypothetical protein
MLEQCWNGDGLSPGILRSDAPVPANLLDLMLSQSREPDLEIELDHESPRVLFHIRMIALSPCLSALESGQWLYVNSVADSLCSIPITEKSAPFPKFSKKDMQN